MQVVDALRALENSEPASGQQGGRAWGPGDKDPVAEQILSTLRIMACGGDGSVTWVLQSIRCVPVQSTERCFFCSLVVQSYDLPACPLIRPSSRCGDEQACAQKILSGMFMCQCPLCSPSPEFVWSRSGCRCDHRHWYGEALSKVQPTQAAHRKAADGFLLSKPMTILAARRKGAKAESETKRAVAGMQ